MSILVVMVAGFNIATSTGFSREAIVKFVLIFVVMTVLVAAAKVFLPEIFSILPKQTQEAFNFVINPWFTIKNLG